LLAKPDPCAFAILVNEDHVGGFKGAADGIDCSILSGQLSCLHLKSLNAGQGQARRFSELFLFPPDQSASGTDLFACDGQFNTSGIDATSSIV
jgi:hypothetical protein